MLDPAEGAVLIFMPGVQEISRLVRMLQQRLGGGSGGAGAGERMIMSLHGSLAPSEQQRVFQPVRRGVIKIVVR